MRKLAWRRKVAWAMRAAIAGLLVVRFLELVLTKLSGCPTQGEATGRARGTEEVR